MLRLVVFATLHSVLAIPRVKENVMRQTGLHPASYRLGYNIISLLVFGWVMSAGSYSAILYEVPGAARYVFYLMQAVLLIALASCLMSTGVMSFLGLDAFTAKSGSTSVQSLTMSGWYGIVRHPLYLFSILFMFLNPVMSVRWLILASLGTLYFVAGAIIEEKRLAREFGETYARYRERVPFIVPSLRKNRMTLNVTQIVLALLVLSSASVAIAPAPAFAEINLPVNGPITSGVGLRLDPFGSGRMIYHRGIDIAVPVGTPVQAVRKGRVVFAGERRGYGATVVVEHDNGDRTMYGHNSLVRVTLGELIESGTVVAFSGNTGRSTGPHVHFEMIPSGQPVIESAGKADQLLQQVTGNGHQRDQYEQQMDDAISSVFRIIGRSTAEGQGGQ